MIAANDDYTPTPAISHAILDYNRGRTSGLADGIVITPSHNPPEDGGFKYNPPHGGPAESDDHRLDRGRGPTNCSADGLTGVKRIPYEQALRAVHDAPARLSRARTSSDLANVLDIDASAARDLRLGVDPLGGAGVHYWPRDRRALRAQSRPSSTRQSIRRSRS